MTSGLDAYAGLIQGYSAGDREYVLTEESITDISGAKASGSELKITKGGASYSFYIPFDSESVTFYTRSSLAGFVASLDGEPLTITEESDEAKTAVFGKSVRKGDHELLLSSDAAANISKIVFNKQKIAVSEEVSRNFAVIDLSEEEKSILTAVVFRTDAPMHLVNGARRYVDYSDITVKPLVEDGTTYIPVHAFARAFGCYYEELPEKKYVLLRKMTTEFLFAEDICYKYEFGEEKELIDNKIKYVNGNAYVPLRFFAESFGEVVGYKDGMIVCDESKHNVSKVLNNEGIYNYVDKKFNDFKVAPRVGNTYHVATTPNASDNNAGTEEKPFRTLSHAGSIVTAGDTVIVHGGTYREILTVKNNGTPTSPIVFKAAEGENPVISAAEEIRTFVSYGDNMVVAEVPWDLGEGRNQVYYNGKTIAEARYPNGPSSNEKHATTSPLSDNWFTWGDIQVPPEDNMTAVSAAGLLDQEEKDYWKGAYFIAMRGTAYAISTAKVASSVKGKLFLEDTSINYWDSGAGNSYNSAFLAGHMNCIDIPNEWVMKDGRLFMIPPEGETAKTLKVEVKKRQLVADLSNNKYVHIKGIDTFGGSMKMNNSEMCMLDGCEIKYNNHFMLSKDQHSGYLDDAKATNTNGAPQRGEVGIYVGGKDNIFINNHFNEAAGSALYVVGLYMYAENNIVESCGYAGSYVAGINVSAEIWKGKNNAIGGHGVYHNTMFNAGRSPWHVSRPRHYDIWPFLPYEVAYNDVHDGMLASQDTGIMYTYFGDHGQDRLKTQMHNNYVYYTTGNTLPYTYGIYHDGGTQNIDTYENITFTTEDNTKFTSYDGRVFVQAAATSFGVCDVWNNRNLGVVNGGPEALKLDQYPNGMPFYAGSHQGKEPFMLNYDNRFNSLDDSYILVDEAELGEGVTLEDGRAVFTEDGQWVKFNDVEFSDEKNTLLLMYSSDKYNTGDLVEFMFDSLDSPTVYNFKYLTQRSRTEDDIDSTYVYIRGIKGTHDVYLRVKDYKSIKIKGIGTYGWASAKPKRTTNIIYCGSFDDYYASNPTFPPEASYGAKGDGANPFVKSTFPGSVLIYDNFTVDHDCTKVTFSWASSGNSGNQPCQIRIGARDAEPIATAYSPTDGWKVYKEDTVELKETLPAGTYTVYITFDNEENTGKSANFYYVDFE